MEIKVASFYLGHNANACFYTQKSGFRIIELERLYNKRYYNLLNANVNELESPILDCLDIAKNIGL